MTREFRKVDKVFLWLLFTLIVLLALSIVIPIVWMIYSSLKDGDIDYILNPFGLPKVIALQNYVDVFKFLVVKVDSGRTVVEFPGMLLNSILYSTFQSVMTVIMPALLAYPVAKYRFKGKELLQTINIVVMVLPIIGSLPAKLALLKSLGIYNNMFLYCLTQHGAFGFNFLLLYGAFSSLSWSYSEAAFIDGASHLQVMLKIMFPMMLPTFAVIFVLTFVGSWNTYEPMLIFLPSFPNLFLGMYLFQRDAGINYATQPQILAGLVIVAIPSALLYLASQKLIMSKFVVGGLKG